MFKHAMKFRLSGARQALAVGAVAAGLTLGSGVAVAADAVKVGLMLPYSGTYAKLGEAITNGVKMAIEENGGTLGGRPVEYISLDSEANPSRAVQNAQQLVAGKNVDFLIGPVHSGVAMGMVKVARETGTITIIPNAGVDAATGPLCAPNIFRTSFSNGQPPYPMGKVAADRGFKKVVTLAWRYGAGQEAVAGFREGFEKAGGTVVEEMYVPFPEVEFQAQLAEIARIKPDAVFVFFAGGGAVQFVKDYHAAGLMDSIPLMGSGFITEGVLGPQGKAAEGVLSTLHYSDQLDTERNRQFVKTYQSKFTMDADIYAVQGYDTGLLMVQAMNAVKGDTENKDALINAMRAARIDSPRGPWTFSKAHNPVQNIYLREVQNGKNVVVGVAAESFDRSGAGCKM